MDQVHAPEDQPPVSEERKPLSGFRKLHGMEIHVHAYGYFCTDIEENGYHTQGKMAERPDTIVYPRLTTVEPPLFQMGEKAAGLILEKIRNHDCPDRTEVVNAEIRMRESSGPPAP